MAKHRWSARQWALLAAVLTMAVLLAVACIGWLSPDMPEPPESPLGFMLIDIADAQAAASFHVEDVGVYVLVVEEGSHAYQAGIQVGDRLLSVNGVEILHSSELMDMQENFSAHQKILMDFWRYSTRSPFETTLIWNEVE